MHWTDLFGTLGLSSLNSNTCCKFAKLIHFQSRLGTAVPPPGGAEDARGCVPGCSPASAQDDGAPWTADLHSTAC